MRWRLQTGRTARWLVLTGLVSLTVFVLVDGVRLTIWPPPFSMFTEYSEAMSTATSRETVYHNTPVVVGPFRMRIYWREEVQMQFVSELGAYSRATKLGRSLDLHRAPDLWRFDPARAAVWLVMWAGLLCVLGLKARINRHRIDRGLCRKCDYDRTGIDPTAPCPECGSPSSPTGAAHS